MDDVYLAELAYNAYCDTTGWKSAVTGAKLPPFTSASDVVRDAWEAASVAVAVQVRSEYR
jgi:hypothetical protein